MPYSIEEIKKMKINELEEVATQMRQDIIMNIKQTGGHLASNLGMVELTIALHYCFDSPQDMIFFDVAHQTYPHKMLTNRNHLFSHLRQLNGLSGFTSPMESIHDVYEGGHSSTSISYALGLLEAKNLYPDLFREMVVVIGDASVVNGLSMEALNYLGSKPKQKMIIILNDNEMGISKNTGGLAGTFNRIRMRGHFKLLRRITPNFIKRILQTAAYKNNLFTGFGLKYLGIIDGHNLKELIGYLKYAKECSSSVILHIKTIKGKGFKFAEEDKTGIWHSVAPFNDETGQITSSSKRTFGSYFCEHLESILPQHPELRIITPGMAYGNGIDELATLFHQQFIDVGIAEENAITMATSMCKGKLLPVIFLYSTFLSRAYDELLIELARHQAHAIICLDRSGIVSGDGPTHQGIFDVAFLNTIPYLKIIAPKSGQEAIQVFDYCMKNEGTYVIRYPKEEIESSNDQVIYPKWQIVKESSNHKYLITYGPNVVKAKNIINDGTGIIDALFIKPYDEELLINLCENNKLFFYEEVCYNNCLSVQVINFLYNLKLDGRISNFEIYQKNLPNNYLEVGTKEELINKYDFTLDTYFEFIKKK